MFWGHAQDVVAFLVVAVTITVAVTDVVATTINTCVPIHRLRSIRPILESQ